MRLVIDTFWWFLPAYIGNMCPVILGAIPFLHALKRPVNEQYFGKNKTILGILAGAMGGLLVAILVGQAWFFGFLMGLGALLGDLLKSFFKRRLKIAPGKSWVPFDQLDFVLGAWLLTGCFFTFPLEYLGVAILITPLLHLLTNIIAYKLGLKKVWW